jgi:hypothetical protein
VAGWWFSTGTLVSSIIKTDRHDIAEIPTTIRSRPRRSLLKRGSIHIKYSMTGLGKGNLLLEVTGTFNCINPLYYIIYIFHLFSSKGQLKEKKGKWKFLKRWKTRYFTLSGAHMTYNKSDHVSKLYCSCTSNGGYSSSSASLECLDIRINSFG